MLPLTQDQKIKAEQYVLNLILTGELKVQQHIKITCEGNTPIDQVRDLTEIEYSDTHTARRPPFIVKVKGNPYSATPGFNISVSITGWGLVEEEHFADGLVEVEKYLTIPYEVIENVSTPV